MSIPSLETRGSRSLPLSQSVVIGGLIAAFVLVVATALLSAIATRGVAAANASIGRVQTTLIALNQIRATLADAEAGQRGFILTGADEYRAAYEQAATRFTQETRPLHTAFRRNPPQLATLGELEELARKKFAGMAEGIELRRRAGIGAAINLVDRDSSGLDALRARLREMEKREFGELAARSDRAAARAQLFQTINVSMIGIALAVAVAGALLLLRRMRQLERLIPVCAWTHRVRDNDRWLTFEEYLGKHFHLRFTHGISEEAAEKMRADAADLTRAAMTLHSETGENLPPVPLPPTMPAPSAAIVPFEPPAVRAANLAR